ncbi:hypothetical protein FA385_25605 [Pseudomonas aeruginosa]|uniref:hypothetical protein n=1 Tax=Pseudomonas aeruginosa TaxID=287 RepID=UPI0007109AE2|nr:hypothetical protein [Pseudomonas aeruginosa]MCO2187674.1 hypothetical protein [Pseudomonas aeruginosa]HCI2725791.1 hypothetical protein [Pseudomonas aeruginosa]
MSKFKAGDLALVINHTFPPVVGTCVELISRHLVGPVDRSNPMDPGVYETPEGEPVWEKWLMPLKGDFHPEQQKAKEEIA